MPPQASKINSEKLDEMANDLSTSELISVLFLMSPTTTEFSLRRLSNVYEKGFLKQEFIWLCKLKSVSKTFLIELFGTIKNYKLLKTFGYCRHRYLKEQNNFTDIPNVWKMLYGICESLDAKELNDLKRQLSQKASITSVEELLINLLESQRITLKDMTALFEVLYEINRSDLAQIVKNSCYSEITESYYIRTPYDKNPCGLAIIINEEDFNDCPSSEGILSNRIGSSHDRDNLDDMWKQFGLETKVYNNLNAEEIWKLFQDISVQESTKDYDVFAICILSHGYEGLIYACDGQSIDIKELLCTITNNTGFLCNKPKLFFIQACQGKMGQSAVNCKTDAIPFLPPCTGLSRMRISLPHKDVFTAMSTIPGYTSFRYEEVGSLFIIKLVETLKEYGDTTSIDECLNFVKRRLSRIQLPIVNTTLRKRLVFKKCISITE